MAEPDCLFCCKLAAHNTSALPPDELVSAFAHSVVLLGSWQHYHGHCLVVSRRHATELSQLGDDERRAYFDEMCLVARALEACFRPHKINYELLGNQVPHLHWHLFPRYRHDAQLLQPVWLAIDRADHDEAERRRLQTGPDDRPTTVDRLRRQIQALRP